uniref:Coiled-coil domain containing 137 n=1 Tax=Nannospalax galili TaxID=1026970 RepID=A0A8C6RV22_NANGA
MAGPRRAAQASARSAGPRGLERLQPRGQQARGQRRWVLQRRENKKVNCKPRNQDEQEIPFRLREIMRSRQDMKRELSNKKRKREGNPDIGKGSKGRGARHRCPQ